METRTNRNSSEECQHRQLRGQRSSSWSLLVPGTHLELLVEFAAVAVQHGQVERTEVCIEAGTRQRVSTGPGPGPGPGAGAVPSQLDSLLIDELVIGAEVVSVGRALGFTPQGGEVQTLCDTHVEHP